MCDTVFALGKSGAYFGECPSSRVGSRLPKELYDVIQEKNPLEIYCLAVGVKGSYVISYKTNEGAHIQTQGLPESLRSWLLEKDPSGNGKRDFTKLKVTLGPHNDSFFATDGESFQWLNLPDALDKVLDDLRSPGGGFSQTPRVVALGALDNYMLLLDSGGGYWGLNNYRTLNKFMAAMLESLGDVSSLHNITLDAHRFEAFILQGASGLVYHHNVAEHAQPEFDKLAKVIQTDTEAMMRQKMQEQTTAGQQNANRLLEAKLAEMRAQQEAALKQQMEYAAMVNAFALI